MKVIYYSCKIIVYYFIMLSPEREIARFIKSWNGQKKCPIREIDYGCGHFMNRIILLLHFSPDSYMNWAYIKSVQFMNWVIICFVLNMTTRNPATPPTVTIKFTLYCEYFSAFFYYVIGILWGSLFHEIFFNRKIQEWKCRKYKF